MPRRLILLVEDNPRDVELMLTHLQDSRFDAEVTVLHDGAEALDYLERRGPFRLREPGEPSVILLDLKMPKVNGLEVLERIRSDPQRRGMPVIFISSSRQEQDLLKAYDLQANAYLIKPVKPEQLVTAIENAIRVATQRPE